MFRFAVRPLSSAPASSDEVWSWELTQTHGWPLSSASVLYRRSNGRISALRVKEDATWEVTYLQALAAAARVWLLIKSTKLRMPHCPDGHTRSADSRWLSASDQRSDFIRADSEHGIARVLEISVRKTIVFLKLRAAVLQFKNRVYALWICWANSVWTRIRLVPYRNRLFKKRMLMTIDNVKDNFHGYKSSWIQVVRAMILRKPNTPMSW